MVNHNSRRDEWKCFESEFEPVVRSSKNGDDDDIIENNYNVL